MFSSSLTEDVRALQEDIDAVAEKVDDAILCQKVEMFVNAPFEIQDMIRRDASEYTGTCLAWRLTAPIVTERQDLLAVILRSPEAPCLDRNQMQRVFHANRAFKQYKAYQADLDDSDDDEGPENDDAWLFEDLTVMMKLLMRRREKEQLLALIFEVRLRPYNMTAC